MLILASTALFAPWFAIEWGGWLPFGLGRCPFMSLFHQPCPSCGLTRGIHAIWAGRWADAVEFNIMAPAVFAVLVAEVVWRIALLRWKRRRVTPRWIDTWDTQIHLALAAAYIAYGLGWALGRYAGFGA